jgi:hypothetical protein
VREKTVANHRSKTIRSDSGITLAPSRELVTKPELVTQCARQFPKRKNGPQRFMRCGPLQKVGLRGFTSKP